MNLVLASSSKTRRQQLEALNINFNCISPDIDETPKAEETPTTLVRRLSIAKAKAVTQGTSQDSLIIAGDQVCFFDDEIIGKPSSLDDAIKQLHRSSGRTIRFYSGLAVLNMQTQAYLDTVVTTDVSFRTLTNAEIHHYVNTVKPLYCAGSFNVEGLGISLFEKIRSDDPTALLGLPMIKLCEFLRGNKMPF